MYAFIIFGSVVGKIPLWLGKATIRSQILGLVADSAAGGIAGA